MLLTCRVVLALRQGARSVTVAAADFFVSYTGADQAWAEWIAEQLEDAGYTKLLQAWDFRPGENFVLQMNQALERADRVLAVLSPAYFGSAYATDEWTPALVRDPAGRDRLLPVRIVPCDLPPLIANRVYVDMVGLDERTAATRLLGGIEPGRAKPAGRRPFPGQPQQQMTRSRFPGRRPEIFNAPARNPNFTGRGNLLKALRRTLRARRAGAVVQASAAYGLGGVSKTQLAVEYAHRFAADYDLVWWIPAEQPVAIPGHLAGLARPARPAGEADQGEQLVLLFEELGRRGRWLLVFDNTTTPHHLAPYRPPAGGGHLLVTSRNPAWIAMATPLPVEVLTTRGGQTFTQVGGSGAEAGDRFGSALAAGDFNDDGFADLAAGAPFEDVGSIDEAGAVSVLFGSAGGLTTSGGQLFTQPAAVELFDNFGAALAAGDFDNNGVADLGVGVPFENVGITSAGAVNVLYGSGAGLGTAGAQTFTQPVSAVEPGDGFGAVVAGGDLNNDGFAELIVSAAGENVGTKQFAGAVSVLYGTAGRLTTSGAQTFTQVGGAVEAGDEFGSALATGDFDNDGFADLAAGAAGEAVGSLGGAGAVNVAYGTAGRLATSTGQLFTQNSTDVPSTAEAGDAFGDALAVDDSGQATAAASPAASASKTPRTLPSR